VGSLSPLSGYAETKRLRERFENGSDSLGGWKHNPDEHTQRI
jgi:hypothetical protein